MSGGLVSTTAAPLLSVCDLSTEFPTRHGTVHAVNGVSFEVKRGAIVGVMGESGCGKSVTIRSILGLVPPPGRVTGGVVEFEGNDLLKMARNDLRELRGDSIGFVAQNPFGALNPILRVREQFRNVIQAHRHDVSGDECDARATSMLNDVGIPGPARVMGGYAHELSGGMAQRVVVAMAMVLDPRLVIADEPTTALDVTIQRQILDLMQGLVRDEDRSMLMVTHDLGVVAQYCDEVVVMYAGKVAERGRAEDVFSSPAHPYTQALIRSVPQRGKAIEVLRGRVPDLVDYPSGCPFADRCAYVHDRCLTEAPPLYEVATSGASRQASCHLIEEGVGVYEPRAG